MNQIIALHTRHVAFKSKIPWYLAKQMTKVFNMNSNQFHQCHERSKDIGFHWFQYKNNYIQLYKPNMSWAILHPTWFFRIRYPYDSRHVQLIKKERHLDCKILEWIQDPFSFKSHKLFHTFFAVKKCNHQNMLFKISI